MTAVTMLREANDRTLAAQRAYEGAEATFAAFAELYLDTLDGDPRFTVDVALELLRSYRSRLVAAREVWHECVAAADAIRVEVRA